MHKLAVIDCGTNTFHLLVVSVNNAEITTEFRWQIPVKLGEGGINQNTIHPQAYNRGLEAMRNFSAKLKELKIDKVAALATSAIRSATNGKQFTETVKAETGLELITISGRKEAELIYKGVLHAYPLGKENELVMDIGGGSVEFIIGNKDNIAWEGSFEIGAARLVEKFHNTDPISPEDVQALNAFLDDELLALHLALKQYPVKKLVGSAGSFDSLCELINAYDSRQLLQNGELWCEIPLAEYEHIHNMLLTSTLEERKNMPGLVDYRVEMMVVASCLINFVLKKYFLSKMFCSTYSLKEGVVFDLMEKVENPAV